jgi:hypothetical protein
VSIVRKVHLAVKVCVAFARIAAVAKLPVEGDPQDTRLPGWLDSDRARGLAVAAVNHVSLVRSAERIDSHIVLFVTDWTDQRKCLPAFFSRDSARGCPEAALSHIVSAVLDP